MRTGPPWIGSRGLPSYVCARSTSSASASARGRFAVYPNGPCATTKRAVGRTRATSKRYLVGTPVHCVSNFDQRVTQWISAVTARAGSARNCSHVNSCGLSTSPKTRKRQAVGSKRGTSPTWSTGKSRAMYCPGGSRFAYRSSTARAILVRLTHLDEPAAGARFHQQHGCTLWVFRLRYPAQHGDSGRTCAEDGSDVAWIQSADREVRHGRVGRGVTNEIDAHRRAAGFCRRRVHRTDTDVVSAEDGRLVDLFGRMRGQSDEEALSCKFAQRLDGQIVLTQMDALRAACEGDVGSVVDDKWDLQAPACCRAASRDLEQVFVIERALAQLHHPDPAGDGRGQESLDRLHFRKSVGDEIQFHLGEDVAEGLVRRAHPPPTI